jgi:hypothetical protein
MNPLDALASLDVLESPFVPRGQIYRAGNRLIIRSVEDLLVMIWVSDMRSALKNNLRRLVAETEARLFGGEA